MKCASERESTDYPEMSIREVPTFHLNLQGRASGQTVSELGCSCQFYNSPTKNRQIYVRTAQFKLNPTILSHQMPLPVRSLLRYRSGWHGCWCRCHKDKKRRMKKVACNPTNQGTLYLSLHHSLEKEWKEGRKAELR